MLQMRQCDKTQTCRTVPFAAFCRTVSCRIVALTGRDSDSARCPISTTTKYRLRFQFCVIQIKVFITHSKYIWKLCISNQDINEYNFNHHNSMFSRNSLNKNIKIISLVQFRTRGIIHTCTVFVRVLIHELFKLTIINILTYNIQLFLFNVIVIETKNTYMDLLQGFIK